MQLKGLTTSLSKGTKTKTGFLAGITRIQHTPKQIPQHILTKTRKPFPINLKINKIRNQTTRDPHSDQQKQVLIKTVTTVENRDTWPRTADREKALSQQDRTLKTT